MAESLTLNEVKDLINTKASEVSDVKVFYSLKQMKIKRISPKTIQAVKLCIGLETLGLSINTNTLCFLLDICPETIRQRLHILGDKKVLNLVRGSKGVAHKWMLSDVFKKYMEA